MAKIMNKADREKWCAESYDAGVKEYDRQCIIELAKEAGFTCYGSANNWPHQWLVYTKNIERFAALVRAEREWIDLTDDEVAECFVAGDEIASGRAVIAAFKEKNK